MWQRAGRLLILLLARIISFLLTRRRVNGIENIPKEGPLLIVVNHLTSYDQYLLITYINRKVIFMAKKELFHSPLIRELAQALGAFPVDRGGTDRKALTQAHRVLNHNLALVMFPEGTRSRNAKLQRALPGSALIALHNNVPILPIGMAGLEVANRGIWWCALHRPRVTVNIGRPFYLPPVADKLTKARLSELADYIMEHIAELLPSEYQGHYARRED